jgi:hypothetical protein
MTREAAIEAIRRHKIFNLPYAKPNWGGYYFKLQCYERWLCDELCQRIAESQKDPAQTIHDFRSHMNDIASEICLNDNHREPGDKAHRAFLDFECYIWVASGNILDVIR